MPGSGITEVEIDLRPAKYQSSLNAFRNMVEDGGKSPFVFATVRTPKNETVDVQVRRTDIYCIAFHGADGWYCFDDQHDGLGKPCGVGSNYSHLGTVGQVTSQDLNSLGELGKFQKGVVLNKRLCAILFAVVSEATRFATAATYFTGMTNNVLPGGMNFEHMRSTYFNNWTKPPSEERVPGKVYHYTKNDILLSRNRS